jgi:hypothetical protein
MGVMARSGSAMAGMAAIVAVMLLAGGCAGVRGDRTGGGSGPSPTRTSARSGDEGIVFGTVQVREGNCMPGPVPAGEPRPNPCNTRPVATTVYAHSPLAVGPAGEPQYPTPGAPVKVVRSAGDGTYELALPAGRYSILVDDGGRPYCNTFEVRAGQSLACPVEVEAGLRTQHDITIDHAFH